MTLPPPPDAAPGWYGDPSGSPRKRFWNGTVWTDDYRESEAAGSASPAVEPVAEPPSSGRSWGCAIVLAVIVLLVLASCGIIAAIGGSSGNDDYKGCSKSLPTDDFQDCINREGVWSGID